MFKKTRQLTFERSYPTPVATVWRAWTEPDLLRQWWGPEHANVTDCDMDLRVGGTIHIVVEASEGMGKYQGIRWPMTGAFNVISAMTQLGYDARTWTEGKANITIEHTNIITFTDHGATTTVHLAVTITKIGPKARTPVLGMKRGYKAYLDRLGQYLTTQ